MKKTNETKVTACESEQPLVKEAINGEMEPPEDASWTWYDNMYR